jgi:hypothetical protein
MLHDIRSLKTADIFLTAVIFHLHSHSATEWRLTDLDAYVSLFSHVNVGINANGNIKQEILGRTDWLLSSHYLLIRNDIF